ncbi:MAG: phospholipase, partial [Planctomycetota bacterium]
DLDACLAAADEQQSEFEEIHKKITARMETVQQDKTRIQEQQTQLRAEFPPSILEDLDRVVASKAEEAVSPVEDSSCSVCNQTLTAQTIDQLTLSFLMRCNSCGAYLFLPKA